MNFNKKQAEQEPAVEAQALAPKAEGKKSGTSFLKSRKFKYGGVATVITILFIVVVIVVNMIVSVLDSKFPMEVDLTPNQIYGLTQDSIDFVGGLEKDVEINILNSKEGFESGGQYYVQAAAIMENYGKYSDRVTVKYVDMVKDPTYAAAYQGETLNANDVMVKCGEKHKLVKSSDLFNSEMNYSTFSYTATSSKAEQSITSAMVNVTSDSITKVAVLSGYDELDTTALASMLTSNNFDVQNVNILTEDIPEDAKLAVVYAPGRDYDKDALKKVDTFLSNGEKLGKTVVYFANPDQVETPQLNAFLEEWGLRVESGTVFESSPSKLFSMNNPFYAIVDYKDETYSAAINNQNIPVAMPNGRPITVLKETESIKTLLEYSASAGVYPVDADDNWDMTSAISGPIAAAVVSTKQVSNVEDKSKVAVVSSCLALDSSLLSKTSLNNSAYFINMFNILAEREDTVTIESKTLGGSALNIMANVSVPLGVVFGIVLPIAVLATGLVIWIRRRNR